MARNELERLTGEADGSLCRSKAGHRYPEGRAGDVSPGPLCGRTPPSWGRRRARRRYPDGCRGGSCGPAGRPSPPVCPRLFWSMRAKGSCSYSFCRSRRPGSGTGVIAAEAHAHLGQVVGAEAEELSLLCNLIGGEGRSGNLHHGAHQVIHLGAHFVEQFYWQYPR